MEIFCLEFGQPFRIQCGVGVNTSQPHLEFGLSVKTFRIQCGVGVNTSQPHLEFGLPAMNFSYPVVWVLIPASHI